ncbi:MAG TPA: hypothetical protein VLI71_07865 [Gammaproteobacteria bacterium]|nr:hypothetical protein [Gammaproteobacteria bacterium]
MNSKTRAPVTRMRAVGAALLLGAQPATAQWDSMPLPGGADALTFGRLTVDTALWSLAASETHRAVLTFDHYPAEIEIAAFGLGGFDVFSLRTLPMVVVRADGVRLRSLVGLRGLRSIYLDRELDERTDVIPWIAQPAEGGRVAMIDSRGPRLLATESRPGTDRQPVAGGKLTVVAALEGFDWVFRHRLEHGIEIVANGWATGGELASTDPLGVATKIARDAGLAVVFAEAFHE